MLIETKGKEKSNKHTNVDGKKCNIISQNILSTKMFYGGYVVQCEGKCLLIATRMSICKGGKMSPLPSDVLAHVNRAGFLSQKQYVLTHPVATL